MSSLRVEEVRVCAKNSRPWGVHPLRHFAWANCSSSTPTGLGVNEHGSKQVPLKGVDSWGQTEGGTDSDTGMCIYCIYLLLGFLFSLDIYLAQSRCSREGFWLSRGQGTLPSLRIGKELSGGSVDTVRREWEERREWEFVLVFFK